MHTRVEPLKILQLVRGFDIGGIHGGAERFGLDLALELKRMGHDVQVSALFRTKSDNETRWIQMLSRAGIPAKFLLDWKGRKITGQYLLAIHRLGNDIRKDPVDICHSHFQVGSIAAVYLRCIRAAKKSIRTAHITREWGTGVVSWFARRVFTDWIFPICLDKEVGVSAAIVAQLDKHPGSCLLGRAPHLIHNAMHFPDFAAKSQPITGKKKKEFVIGSVGRLTRQKGFDLLIRSVPAVLSKIAAKFYIIGDGEQRGELEALVKKLGLEDSVIFTGQVSNVPDFFKEMDIFVLSSLWEGLPTVVLEAMFHGIPVVATDIPGTDELISPNRNGWLAKPGDPICLADVIIRAATSPETSRRYSEQAKKDVKKYSLAIIAREYEDLYEVLLSPNAGVNPGLF